MKRTKCSCPTAWLVLGAALVVIWLALPLAAQATTYSYTDLNPRGFADSHAFAISGGQQAGDGSTREPLSYRTLRWSGTAIVGWCWRAGGRRTRATEGKPNLAYVHPSLRSQLSGRALPGYGEMTTCSKGKTRYTFRMSVKEQVLQAIQRLPDDISFRDVTDEIALLAAIEDAERDIEDGRLISNDEMKSRISQWSAR